MTNQAENRPRGRPRSPAEGAREAYDFIEAFRNKRGISRNEMALLFGMTPSTVSRNLPEDPGLCRMRPGLRKIYGIALNWKDADPAGGNVQKIGTAADMQVVATSPALLLARYSGPGEGVVRRILQDVAELVATIKPAG
jgi:hypothetical protein